jgi:multicomponent Na+:H+ antiporter subunit D
MNLSQHFPVLIIATPIITAVIISIVSFWWKHWLIPMAAVSLVSSLAMTISLVPRVLSEGFVNYYVSSWRPPIGIEIKIDYIGIFVMLIVEAISLLILIYSQPYITKKIEKDKTTAFYVLYLLLSASMLGFAATGDIFNMFVFIEIMAIASYALVAVDGSGPAVKAAMKYLLIGAPSSIIILLAISFLYTATGTLNMGDLTVQIGVSPMPRLVVMAYALFITGFAIKSALFPLHVWLPDAQTFAPSPVSALLAGLVEKMGILGTIRMTYNIFTLRFSHNINEIGGLLPYLGVLAIAYGSVMAVKQRDLNRMLAYSTIAHIGYIFIGVGLFNVTTMVGGIYHILDHALAKTCLFLVAGIFIYRTGYRRIDQLKGASKKMPLSCAAFTAASLSIVGIPPTAGFFSKWYLVSGSFHAGNFLFGAAILLGSLVSAWYCFRIIYCMYLLPPENYGWENGDREAPALLIGPVCVLALLTLVMGVFSYTVIPSLEKALKVLF